MKIDALICAAVLALAIVVPILGFWSGGEKWLKHRGDSLASAGKYEQLVRDVESGKVKPPDSATYSAMLRLQVQEDLQVAALYGYLADADRKFLSAALGFAGLQAALLGWLLMRRRGERREAP